MVTHEQRTAERLVAQHNQIGNGERWKLVKSSRGSHPTIRIDHENGQIDTLEVRTIREPYLGEFYGRR